MLEESVYRIGQPREARRRREFAPTSLTMLGSCDPIVPTPCCCQLQVELPTLVQKMKRFNVLYWGYLQLSRVDWPPTFRMGLEVSRQALGGGQRRTVGIVRPQEGSCWPVAGQDVDRPMGSETEVFASQVGCSSAATAGTTPVRSSSGVVSGAFPQ